MTIEKIDYKDYTISSDPRPVEDTGMWAAEMTISRISGGEEESWMISAGDEYSSREEALRRCFDFGKELIDREMEGCSLD